MNDCPYDKTPYSVYCPFKLREECSLVSPTQCHWESVTKDEVKYAENTGGV
jgi:hypothetical protein